MSSRKSRTACGSAWSPASARPTRCCARCRRTPSSTDAMRGGSQSFDRAAAFYDRTRITDPVQLEAAIDLLDRTLPAGSALEIGVGTGALAVPLADRGRRVVGVDLSASMLERLRSKDP